jgi:hypothetical protein
MHSSKYYVYYYVYIMYIIVHLLVLIEFVCYMFISGHFVTFSAYGITSGAVKCDKSEPYCYIKIDRPVLLL